MNIKRYTTRDESAGYISCEDKDLSLLNVCQITDWTDEQFDLISNMKIYDYYKFNGISVERTA